MIAGRRWSPRRPARAAGAAAAVVAIVAASGVPALADETAAAVASGPVTRERRGLSLGIGLGYVYGGAGLRAGYDLPLRRIWTVTPFVGGGFYFNSTMGAAAGVTNALGVRHRLVVDLAVAPVEGRILNLHGTDITARVLYGPAVGIGYEHMSDRGVSQRFTLAYGHPMWGAPLGGYPIAAMVNFGFAARLW